MQSSAAAAMVRHRCKLCHRRFPSGRALAGHMRSHVPPAPRRRPLPCPSVSSSSPSAKAATTQEDKASASYALCEDRRKSFLPAHPEFSSSSAMQDRESDAESPLHRLPKRRRLPEESAAADELQSSVSDASSEEEVARSLVLLSRDAWSRSEAGECESNCRDEVEGDVIREEGDGEEDGIRSRSRRQSRFQCGTCRKVFRSYQALGGHRASHKRVGVECVPITTGNRICGGDSSDATIAHRNRKIWECPYCYRVFGSGQALGGHKRSHLYSAAAAAAAASTSPALPLRRPPSSSAAATNDSCINLNLPAPLGDEAELSALSVATEYAHN